MRLLLAGVALAARLAACGSSATPAENVARGEAGDFPKTPNGAIDEAKLPHGAILGAVNVPAGGRCDLTLRLTPGPYTPACNLAEDTDVDDVHAHFAKGMHANLDVST